MVPPLPLRMLLPLSPTPMLPLHPIVSHTSLAINVASVKTHVPICLDLKASNYAQWRMFINVLLGRFDLLHHVATDADPWPTDTTWARLDFLVCSCLYSSISKEILDIIVEPDQTARPAWVNIKDLFLGNKRSHAIFIEAEFRNVMQGDLPISAYYHKLKTLVDALRDVDNLFPTRRSS